MITTTPDKAKALIKMSADQGFKYAKEKLDIMEHPVKNMHNTFFNPWKL